MGQELTPTSYALLGLLSFREEMTGYEVKQFADATLRFYWVSPAMSQIYTELARLADARLVRARERTVGERVTRTFRITAAGRRALTAWLVESPVEFPVLKHPVALRLLLGHLSGPGPMREMLERYAVALADRRTELAAVRENIGDDDNFAYPALVAEWGLRYYDDEAAVVADLASRLEDLAAGEVDDESGRDGGHAGGGAARRGTP
jgi:DNA-binding PadR family transcriptional regulator